jgi:hypothetical protein
LKVSFLCAFLPNQWQKNTTFGLSRLDRPYCWVLEICRFLTSVWRGFFSISLNLHSTGDSAVGFSTGEIGDMDESVIESGQKMDNTEVVNILLGTNLRWTEVGLLLLLNFNVLLWWL